MKLLDGTQGGYGQVNSILIHFLWNDKRSSRDTDTLCTIPISLYRKVIAGQWNAL